VQNLTQLAHDELCLFDNPYGHFDFVPIILLGRSDMTPRLSLSVALGAAMVTCFLGCSRSDSRAAFLSSLPRYERVVGSMESGSVPMPAQFGEVRLASEDARLAQNVFAGRDTNGVLTVMFFTRSGFPALHS
jgi:hypothetical protein